MTTTTTEEIGVEDSAGRLAVLLRHLVEPLLLPFVERRREGAPSDFECPYCFRLASADAALIEHAADCRGALAYQLISRGSPDAHGPPGTGRELTPAVEAQLGETAALALLAEWAGGFRAGGGPPARLDDLLRRTDLLLGFGAPAALLRQVLVTLDLYLAEQGELEPDASVAEQGFVAGRINRLRERLRAEVFRYNLACAPETVVGTLGAVNARLRACSGGDVAVIARRVEGEPHLCLLTDVREPAAEPVVYDARLALRVLADLHDNADADDALEALREADPDAPAGLANYFVVPGKGEVEREEYRVGRARRVLCRARRRGESEAGAWRELGAGEVAERVGRAGTDDVGMWLAALGFGRGRAVSEGGRRGDDDD